MLTAVRLCRWSLAGFATAAARWPPCGLPSRFVFFLEDSKKNQNASALPLKESAVTGVVGFVRKKKTGVSPAEAAGLTAGFLRVFAERLSPFFPQNKSVGK